MRVVEKIDRRPGWLMARRGVGAGDHAKADLYLSNAPETVALAEMAWVGCLGWAIEVDFELAKGRIGLDHHEVTKYQGWYQHTTLCLLALAFLKLVQFEWGNKWRDRLGSGSTPTAPSGRCPDGLESRNPRSPGSAINNAAKLPPEPVTGSAACVSTRDE